MEDTTVRNALIEYARRVRDAMYTAFEKDDEKALDAAFKRCRQVTEYMWGLGRELDKAGGLMEPFKHCPSCGSTRFWTGPRGGASMNVTCVTCGDRFNLLVHEGAPIMLIDDALPAAEILDTTEENP